MCGFSVKLILKGIMTFQSYRVQALVEQKVNFNKNGIESGKSHIHCQRDKPCVSSHRTIVNKNYNCDELELAKEKRQFFLTLILS